MGRAKVPMKFIECPKARNATFMKRRKGLKKKTFEFATLCGVDVCMICFGPQGDRQYEPEIWPNDPMEVRRILKRYEDLSKEEQCRRKLDLTSFLEERKKKLEDELNQRSRERAALMYPPWDERLNGLSLEALRELLETLDLKLEEVGRKIQLIKYHQDGFQGKEIAVDDLPQNYPNQGLMDMFELMDEKELVPVLQPIQPLPIAYAKPLEQRHVPMELSYFPNMPNFSYSGFNTNSENMLAPTTRSCYVSPGIGTLEANMFQYQNDLHDADYLQSVMRLQSSVMGSPSSSSTNLNSGSVHKLLVHQSHHMNHGFSEFQMIQTKRGRY